MLVMREKKTQKQTTDGLILVFLTHFLTLFSTMNQKNSTGKKHERQQTMMGVQAI